MRLKLFGILAAAITLPGCAEEPKVAADGARIAASLAAVWDMGESPGRQAIFSPDGKFLAASNAAGELVIRRSSDWKVTRRLRHPGGATALAVTPDSRSLISAGYDGRVRVWDLETGRHHDMAVAKGTIWTLDAAPDSSRIAAAGEDQTIHLQPIHGSQGAAFLRGHERNIWEISFSPDGNHLASGSFDETARIWNLDGTNPRILRGHTEAVVGLAYSPDGQILATGGDDSTIRLWRGRDGAPLRSIAAGNHVYKLAFSPDGHWLASGGRARGAVATFWYGLTGHGARASPVKIWRVADGALIAALPDPTDVYSVSFNPDGRYLAANDDAGDIRLWRLEARA